MVSAVQRADIQRLEARKAQLIALRKANQDVKPLLTSGEVHELETEGFDKVIEGIDELIEHKKIEPNW